MFEWFRKWQSWEPSRDVMLRILEVLWADPRPRSTENVAIQILMDHLNEPAKILDPDLVEQSLKWMEKRLLVQKRIWRMSVEERALNTFAMPPKPARVDYWEVIVPRQWFEVRYPPDWQPE